MSGNEYSSSVANFIRGKCGSNEPMPSKEELMSRNSFGTPSENKYLDKMLGVKGVKRRVIKLK